MVPGEAPLKKVLYISYDGMTDPLGQSQVLPYLAGLAKCGYQFTILSFEKTNRFDKQRSLIEKIVNEAGIKWVPLSFTTKPPIVSKIYDVIRMRRTVLKLYHEEKFDMVHCRGYITADLGMLLKGKFGVKFFFDMRGFWADEKKDGGAWDQSSFIFRKVYKYYKKRETEYISNADCIISLTEAGKREMTKWPGYNSRVPLYVIPCCADMDLFSLTSAKQKYESRDMLQIKQDALVISYLGSVGSWYMLPEMIELFSLIKKKYSNAFFLFVTPSDPNLILSMLVKYELTADDVKIIEASRQQVPVFVKASDINISFIKPVYSKISSSPTKLGEVLSMGIPVIANSGVGDVEAIVQQSEGGITITNFTQGEYQRAIDAIAMLVNCNPAAIRNNIATVYDLKRGVEKYNQAYLHAMK